MAYFPHTGGSYQHFTPLALSTFNNVLSDIIADVGGGTNGWTVFDDQRTLSGHAGGTYSVLLNVGGAQIVGGAYGSTWAASTALTGTGTRYLRSFIPTVSEVSPDGGTNWRVVSAVASDVAATLGVAWTGVLTQIKTAVEKVFGYVVLKYTSTQKTYYVQIIRPKSYADLVRIRCWETWDAGTHVGTGQLGPEEIVRAYSGQKTGTTSVQYVMFLLADAFVFWGGGDPAQVGTTNYWDLYYAGNLNPLRGAADYANAFFQASSSQELSGFYLTAPAIGATGLTGGGILYRAINGTTWSPTTYQNDCSGVVHPRGMTYLDDVTRPLLDESGKLQFVDCDVYQASGMSQAQITDGKRGDLRYLKLSCGNPSAQHLSTFGPADDGNTYMMLRTSYPMQVCSGAAATIDSGATGINAPTGFGFTTRSGQLMEINVATASPIALWRFFLLPTNL